MKKIKGNQDNIKAKNEEQKGRGNVLCTYQGFMFLFVLMRASYFSVLFNPKRALPPWASGGWILRGPGAR